MNKNHLENSFKMQISEPYNPSILIKSIWDEDLEFTQLLKHSRLPMDPSFRNIESAD